MPSVVEQSLDRALIELAALRERITELEAQFKAVVDLKGIQGKDGPRGPAGDASYATRVAASEAAGEIRKVVNTAANLFKADLGEITAQFADLKKQLGETIQTTVENELVKTLQAYQVLDSEMNLHAGMVAYTISKINKS